MSAGYAALFSVRAGAPAARPLRRFPSSCAGVRLPAAAALALAALLAGCGGNASTAAEGPGSETSGLTARIVDAAGRPLAGIAVRAVALDRAWREEVSLGRTPVLDRDTTDSRGIARFDLPGAARIAVEIEDTLLAGRQEVQLSPTTPGDVRLTASSGGHTRVAATVPGETIRSVFLAGTGYLAVRDAADSWSFPAAPAGWYTVAARTELGLALLGRLRIDPSQPLDTTLSADADSVLLEDWAAPAVRNRYGELLGAGWWYTTTDAIYGGRSTTTPALAEDGRKSCAEGPCLEMSFALDTAHPMRFALVGTDLDRSKNPIDGAQRLADLSRVTTVRFWASGSGPVRVQIHYAVDTSSVSCYQNVWLDETWRAREVQVDAMSCESNAVPDRARAIGMTFLTVSDLRLRLGRIALLGAGPRSVFPDLNQGGAP